jgi:aspartate/glutamate racemase
MKTIGIVGGVAWPSLGGLHCANLVERAVDLPFLHIVDPTARQILAELARGSFLPATRAKFKAAITDLVTRGAEVIILACTEFGMLVQADDSPVPIIDTTIAHAEAAVELALH